MTAVSDAFGAVHNVNGLDVKALRQHLKDGNAIDTFTAGKSLHESCSAWGILHG